MSWVNFWKERKKSIEVINKAYAGVGPRVGLLFISIRLTKIRNMKGTFYIIREREKKSEQGNFLEINKSNNRSHK